MPQPLPPPISTGNAMSRRAQPSQLQRREVAQQLANTDAADRMALPLQSPPTPSVPSDSVEAVSARVALASKKLLTNERLMPPAPTMDALVDFSATMEVRRAAAAVGCNE